jgi:WD40 repeat protein
VLIPDDITCSGGEVTVWDLKDLSRFPEELSVLPELEHNTFVTSAAVNSKQGIVVLGMNNGSINFWNLRDTSPLQIDLFPGEYAVFSRSASLLAIRNGDTTLSLWDINNLKSPSKFYTLLAESIAFGPGNKSAATILGEQIKLWDTSDLTIPRQLATVSDPDSVTIRKKRSALFSPDGQILASASCQDANKNTCIQGKIVLWDVTDLQRPRIMTSLLPTEELLSYEQGSGIEAIAFHPAGGLFAAGTERGSIFLWDISDPLKPFQIGMIVGPQSPLENPATSVTFNPAGNLLVAGYFMNNIKIWDISHPSNPIELATLSSIGRITSVVFDSSGKVLAAGGTGGITLWDTSEPDNPIELVTIPQDVQTYLSFEPNGQFLASYIENFGETGKGISIWNLDPSFWIEVSCRRAGRNFTREEWKLYFPNETYRKTCEQWPLESEITPTAIP